MSSKSEFSGEGPTIHIHTSLGVLPVTLQGVISLVKRGQIPTVAGNPDEQIRDYNIIRKALGQEPLTKEEEDDLKMI